MKRLLARMMFWRRRNDLTWDEIVDFPSRGSERCLTILMLEARAS